MSCFYSWIYVDSKNNIWKFYRNDNYELCYKIMYDDGKWIKDKVIDKNVLEVFVYVEDEMIHIVYIDLKNKLKYCTMKENQWLGRTIYQIENSGFELLNLKVEIIGSEMHIFFIKVEKHIRNHAELMQCVWSSSDISTSKIQEIAFNYNLMENYFIQMDENGSLGMLFLTGEEDGFGLNYSNYKNHNWSIEKRLYSIQGEEITFEMLVNKQGIHILNKYKEDSFYYLDYIFIDNNDNMNESRVYESNMEVLEPVLLVIGTVLYTFWLEENRICYSSYLGNKWRKETRYKIKNDQIIEKYHIYTGDTNECKVKKLYGCGDLDLALYFPEQLVTCDVGNEIPEEMRIEIKELDDKGKIESIQTYKAEMTRMKSEINELNKKLASLNMQLQRRKRVIDEQENQLNKALEVKLKVEENNKVYLKFQKKLQDEIESMKLQLKKEQRDNYELENKNKLSNEAVSKAMQEYEMLIQEDNILKQENELIKHENELIKQENERIKQENERIKQEKEQLQMKIECKKNKSIMDRLLKVKSSEIQE